MSLIISGKMQDDWLESEQEAGEFVRKDSVFRHRGSTLQWHHYGAGVMGQKS